MELRVFTEPQQGASYDELLRVARAAEEGGFGAFFRSDHYMHMGGADPLPGPTDAWMTLAGLARDTETIRLGTLLSPATFRLPGPLAIAVAQADAMSQGRVELGLGAGWYAEEHTAYGIPYPATAERFDRLEEQLEIVKGLWTTEPGEQYSYSGQHYNLTDSPALPKPVQKPHPPVIVGGHGKRRTPHLAARFADELNVAFAPREECAAVFEAAERACETEGRDPATLLRSVALVACCGTDEKEVERRAAAIGRQPEELRANGAAGTPAEVLDHLATFSEIGVERVYLQFLDISDLEQLDLVSKEVMGPLA